MGRKYEPASEPQAIPACTVDCGKFDSDDTSDFGFFDKLNTLNVITLDQTSHGSLVRES